VLLKSDDFEKMADRDYTYLCYMLFDILLKSAKKRLSR